MILLDTHILIWLAGEPAKLSRRASDAIHTASQESGIAISAITLWELAWLGPMFYNGDGITALSERARMEFRGEAFNLTNTPPLTSPNVSFGTSAFGTITRALDPRVFELVLKLHF